MPDPVVDYETAASGFADVLARCSDDDLKMPSPCEGWTAQDVVDHVMGGPAYYAEAWGGAGPEVPDDADRATRYAAGARALAEVCRRDGVLEQMVASPLGGGEIPAGMMFSILTSDTLIHTWDLARAIDADVQLDQDLLQRTWDGLIPIEEMVRRPEVFGPPVEVDADAPLQDRAMAWFGRTP
ncbi:MAG: TIGR03086 family metal-binding protein [Acidimicrobiales bacterium]